MDISNSLQFVAGLSLGIGLSVVTSRYILTSGSPKEDFNNPEVSDSEEEDWEDVDDSSDDDEAEDDENDEEPVKMVLAVRMDLKMGKGTFFSIFSATRNLFRKVKHFR